MVEPIWQRLSLENLYLNPFPEGFVSNYLDLAIFMDPASHQKCTKTKMEPYLGTCYDQNNTTMCDVSFHTTSNNLIYCQPGAFTDVKHSVKSNICAADTKHGNYIDKERYKIIRKWKRIGKSKNCYFSFSNAKKMDMYICVCVYNITYYLKNIIYYTFLDKLTSNVDDSFILRLLSFNILAQNLLEDHSYLYQDHNKKALSWKIRKPLLIQEIREADANVYTYFSIFSSVKFKKIANETIL